MRSIVVDQKTTEIARLGAAELAAWPGGERRVPTRSDRHYLVLEPLSRQLREAIDRLLDGRHDARVLDVGCGVKPYLPFVASHAGTYIGIDAEPGPHVDAVGPAEQLPVPDEAFELVLCTQVLEHVEDPARALSEIHRVLVPGGAALLSTHGVSLYHPDPPDSGRDYWRWTHSGLEKALSGAGEWRSIEVQPNGNAIACLAYVLAQYVDELGSRLGVDAVRRAMLLVLNWVAEAIDRRFPPRARVPAPGSLTANYLVTAVKS